MWKALPLLLLVACSNPNRSPDVCFAYTALNPIATVFTQQSGGRTALLGDSILQLGALTTGFITEHDTRNYAVGGNTLCDVALLVAVLPDTGLTTFIVDGGGNDLMQGIPVELIGQTQLQLLFALQRFPIEHLVWIGVPPTRTGADPLELNAVLRAGLAVMYPRGCFIDPRWAYATPDQAIEGTLIDDRHPTAPIYMRLRQDIERCGVVF